MFEAEIDFTTENGRGVPSRKTKRVSAKTSERLGAAVLKAQAKLEDRGCYNLVVRYAAVQS